MGPADWLLLVTLSVLWGGSFLFTGIAVRELPPLTIVTLRVGIAAVALLALLRVMGIAMPVTNRFWLVCFGMGLLNNVVPFNLSAWAQTQITSGLAAILNATTPLFAVLVTHALTEDEKATAPKLVGVVVGFAGVALMIGPDAFSADSALLPQLAVLGCGLSYAFSGVFGRRFKALGQPPIVAAAGQLTASTALLLPVLFVVDPPWTTPLPSAGVLAAVLALALASTAFAYILFFRILASAGATNLMLVTFLIPVSAVLLGALLLGERLEAKHAAGMALIALGLAAIDGRLFALARRRLSGG
ncbi:threonine/homoserine efflux transporter RhtA [Enterovirga rhinocerotis]|uniref:Threonine/homoserine efflux transporter RhtA n=2 Tax=Enterovirga rhinocerotis TaxID=1339210 RepID=A0A4R7BVX4_9HYPH|nr:threonine/homoserine efflux transporter RhtA [Enterovirga rhinocerotis]